MTMQEQQYAGSPSRLRRWTVVVSVLAAAVSAAAALPASPAVASGVQHAEVVEADPADWTPHALDGTVYDILQVGNRVYMGGSFTEVRNSNQSARLAMPSLVAFDATTGRIDTAFTPVVGGTVYALAPSADGRSIYVGGAFTSVNGASRRRVARLDAATGANWAGFVPPNVSALVNDLAVVGNRLIVGGAFQTIDGVTRRGLAALDAATGAVDSSINLNLNGARRTSTGRTGPVSVEAMDVTPDGQRMVILGNFSSVAGQARHQVAVINLGVNPATLSGWSTTRYQPQCSTAHPSYVRDVSISGDGRWFAIVSTGYTYPGQICDAAARWEFGTDGPNKQPTWINYTGGDTLLSVAVTGPAVYVGGHQRWLDGTSSPGQARTSVSREGIGAIHPTTGKALAWNPGKERGVGTAVVHAGPGGLWIGSDTSMVAGEFHGKIAYFPLPGAVPPPNTPPTAAFSTACTQLTCSFNAAAATDPDGTITSYAWTFGDGGTATGVSPSRTYATAGSYPVQLTVTDNAGATATLTQQVTVTNTPPATAIGFRGTDGVNTNSASPRTTVPAAVQAGDGLLLTLTSNTPSATISAPTGVAGWTELGRVDTGSALSVVWRKVAVAGDAGAPVTVPLSVSSKVDLRVLAYAGTSTADPVADFATRADATTTTSHVSPTVNVDGAGRWAVTMWSDKSSTTTAWTAPAEATARATGVGIGSGRVTALLADSAGAVPTGTYGGLTATTDAASRAMSWTIVLAPAG